ncbi:MAG: phosphonate C-P lyase system protein PhnG [Chloroflexi bacterium]|uniref:Phosphonate C-P lyase system protein PhnG n=1 Tax=Candidatus Chlorohelix allophototropha TaxID=3003348 RepID=A0A8T7M579_9CHLR|nr:phosphonate C-P lyase system protein PhnG [Chloroflexota bacterium]WJW69135.1 phosphonate C-P lyase system protein PhnG [Chloroflexota bacterium L227-S17]
MNHPQINHYQILANCEELLVCQLAEKVLMEYPTGQLRLLSGPLQGLVMLRMRESVEDRQFNAGEILVTEVKLELDGQFGYGMVLGKSERRAMAVALVDAALRKDGLLAEWLKTELERINEILLSNRERLYQIVNTTRVEFETM